MGSVYKVRNVISDRCDAMKVLLPDLRDSAELAERFLNEIKVLAGLSHPNIASLYTALRVDNQLLMVMELVDGVTLEEHINRGSIPLDQSLIYIAQVLSALSYAHHHGVIHRDIKPANMAIHSDGRVKLLDFGIARANQDQRFTQAGMVLGSLHYMSPEQIAGKQADARSDLYSVGVTLYRMVTGKRPFDGDNSLAIMRAQSETPAIPPRQINPALPETISAAILRSLAKAPEERFQTADEFRRALEGAYSSDAIETVLMATTPTPSSSRFHAAVLSVLQKNLGVALGPIAGALVRKHSRSSETVGKIMHCARRTDLGGRGSPCVPHRVRERTRTGHVQRHSAHVQSERGDTCAAEGDGRLGAGPTRQRQAESGKVHRTAGKSGGRPRGAKSRKRKRIVLVAQR